MNWRALILLISFICLILLSFYYTDALSDKNKFLSGFVNHELLGFMGVLVTITLATSTNLVINLYRLEVLTGKNSFKNTIKDLKDSSYLLIYSLIIVFSLVIAKPIFSNNEIIESILNASAVTCVLGAVLMLLDITRTAFVLAPMIGGHLDRDEGE